jgi:hypothetical protein
MLQIDDKIISLDVLDKSFVCDLKRCKGACCVQGDSGAPLEDREVKVLKKIFPKIKRYLREESIKTIEKAGTHVVDADGDKVTPLNDGKECAYAIFENGIAYCSFEKAYNDKVIKFKKPLSCHLYPVRVKKYEKFDGINLDHWEVCNPARELGSKLNVPVYVFLKESITRKYGKSFYKELEAAALRYAETSGSFANHK